METRILRPVALEFSVARWQAVLAMLGVLGLSFLLAREILRVASDAQLGTSANPIQLRQALIREPDNPELHHELGMALLSHFVAPFSIGMQPDARPAEIIAELRSATELSPQNPFFWADLGSACETLGDGVCADRAFERALKFDAMNPTPYWLAGNHYLRGERHDAALSAFRQLLALDPGFALPTFRVCLRALSNPAVIFKELLPPQSDPGLKLAFLNTLVGLGHTEGSYQLWAEAIASAPHFPFALAEPFLEGLLSQGQIGEANRVWQDLGKMGVVNPPSVQDEDNLVFNGGFEQIPLNAGFDWHYRETPYVTLDFADTSAYQGAHCLRIDFTVPRNEEYEPVYELVAVAPMHSYVLRAYVKSNSITSESGPCLRVLDPNCPACLDASSEGGVGATPWHPLSLRFSTQASTQLVRVSVWRPLGRTYPMEISGSFWLDQVSVRSMDSGPAARSSPTAH
jgi:tetratricopeptide (TPR) repeat protein